MLWAKLKANPIGFASLFLAAEGFELATKGL